MLNNIKPLLIKKCPTGIAGLDEITMGGLPRNRATLVCGGPGSGKSMMCMEFLIRGARDYKEPGLFVAFEETEQELRQNVASLGYDVKDLLARNKLILNHIQVDRSQFTEIGNYNLEGLFIQIGALIDKYKIKRVALDTIEVLFANLGNESIVRSELQRLFRWFKAKKVTVIITAEQGTQTFSRYGLEEYVADCVILLDNRMDHQISTRRIRVAKYRGSPHGNNEYPFIITDKGFSITAITSITLNYKATTKRISSGIKQLDRMLDDKGFYRASSILVSGPTGIGKSSLGAAFALSTCQRGERCIYFAFEESVDQIVRNMKSIGFDLEPWLKKGNLYIHAINPNTAGLETHLAELQQLTQEFKPNAIVMDPITNLRVVGSTHEVHDVLSILIAFFKCRGITAMFLNLVSGASGIATVKTTEGISSLMDTSIYMEYLYSEGESNRVLGILKARGMQHSNQVREIVISSKGIQLQDVYTGQGKVLTGSARLVQATKEAIENTKREATVLQRAQELAFLHKNIEQKISRLYGRLEQVAMEKSNLSREKDDIKSIINKSDKEISKIRMADIEKPQAKHRLNGDTHGKRKKAKKKSQEKN